MNRSNERRYNALSKGLCGRCYIRPVILPTARCKECAEVQNKPGAERARESRRRYKENHQCTRCGAPLEEGEQFKNCMNCRNSKTLQPTMKARKYATN